MWIKGDRTECRTDITELEWTDNNTTKEPLTVATKDSDDIIFQLNILMLLEDFLENEDKHLDKMIKDPTINSIDKKGVKVYKYYMDYLLNRWKQVVDEARENGVLIQ